ncbi:hypothetical protein HNY73_004271 [Argiope bruennichi]|uniref:Uncharacterized protein n=1 Tax=Argiope bruennichi TaxID=94029 RepID=A0A8T0FQ42_ARGBR|nr:hypothetical protein HNY73_004271 [Argiope bruennichi]
MKTLLCAILLLSILLLTSGQEDANQSGVMRRPPAINRCCLYGWVDCCGYLFGYRYGVLPVQYPSYPPMPVVNPLINNYIA